MKTVICNFAPQHEEMEIEEVRLTFVSDEFKHSGNQISYIAVSRLDDIGYDRTYVANGFDELTEILDKLNIIHPQDVGVIRTAFLTNKLFRKKFFYTWKYAEDGLEADVNGMQVMLMEKVYDYTTDLFGRELEHQLANNLEKCLEDGFVKIESPKMCELLNYIKCEGRMGDKELYAYDFDLCLPSGVKIDKSNGMEGFHWDINTGMVALYIEKLTKEEMAETYETLAKLGLV